MPADAGTKQYLSAFFGMPETYAGITPRDYALTTLHLGVNWMAVMMEDQFKKAGTAPAGVAGDNWRLVHANRARIAQLMTELQRYTFKVDGESDDDDEG